MAYNEELAMRVRSALQTGKIRFEEKSMFGGLSFMVRDKMCCGVLKDDLVIRIDPDQHEELLKKRHVRPMDFTGKPMKGWIYVAPQGIRTEAALQDFLELALAYSVLSKKSSAKKRPAKKKQLTKKL